MASRSSEGEFEAPVKADCSHSPSSKTGRRAESCQGGRSERARRDVGTGDATFGRSTARLKGFGRSLVEIKRDDEMALRA